MRNMAPKTARGGKGVQGKGDGKGKGKGGKAAVVAGKGKDKGKETSKGKGKGEGKAGEGKDQGPKDRGMAPGDYVEELREMQRALRNIEKNTWSSSDWLRHSSARDHIWEMRQMKLDIEPHEAMRLNMTAWTGYFGP